MASWSNSAGNSGVQYYGGQEQALSGVFGPGGVFEQFLSGKPNAGYERAQTQGLEQLKRGLAQQGTLNTPLGTRALSDYATKTTQAAGDNFLQSLFAFMQPAGQTSKSRASGVGIL